MEILGKTEVVENSTFQLRQALDLLLRAGQNVYYKSSALLQNSLPR